MRFHDPNQDGFSNPTQTRRLSLAVNTLGWFWHRHVRENQFTIAHLEPRFRIASSFVAVIIRDIVFIEHDHDEFDRITGLPILKGEKFLIGSIATLGQIEHAILQNPR